MGEWFLGLASAFWRKDAAAVELARDSSPPAAVRLKPEATRSEPSKPPTADEGQPDDEPIPFDGPHRRASGRNPEAFLEIVAADPRRSAPPRPRPEIVPEHGRRVLDPHTDVQRSVRPGGVVLQRVLKQLGERHGRQEQLPGVGL